MTDRLILDGTKGEREFFDTQDFTVVGAAAAETLTVNQGATISSFGANTGDRVNLNGNIEDYDITASGNNIVFTDTTGDNAGSVTVALNAATTIAFADGGATAEVVSGDSGLEVQLGGQAVGSSPVDTSQVSLDSNITSDADTFVPGTVDGGDFSVSESANDVDEGQTLTYTIETSDGSNVSSDTDVDFNIGGDVDADDFANRDSLSGRRRSRRAAARPRST